MASVYLILALAFAVVIAIFAVQNTAPSTVSFLAWHVDNMAVSVLVLISAALGAATALVLSVPRELQTRFRHRGLRQRLKAAEERSTGLEARVRDLEAQLAPPPEPALPEPALPAPEPPGR